jgi:hypothetical protein
MARFLEPYHQEPNARCSAGESERPVAARRARAVVTSAAPVRQTSQAYVRTVPSTPEVRITVPVGSNDADVSGPVWPRR